MNIALVGLTAVVIYFAWRTVRESRKATSALREAADALVGVKRNLTVTWSGAG
jgi:hypothetical protein